MNILYWAPNCGSGVEQIGFVYLLLLKSLGHTIDFTNTQSMNIHKKELKNLIHSNNYDYIIFNEATDTMFNRTNYKNYLKNKVFNICHSSIKVPNNVIALSLNYLLHNKISNSYPITIPLSYPFLYKKLNKKDFENRKYGMAFIGRYHFTKFHKDVENFLNKNNIRMDYSVVSNNYENEIPSVMQFNNLNINEIYNLLLDTQYLLLPSTTECLSLVVGEAQVCGCIPIVLETKDLEHEQFELSYKCFSTKDFNDTILKIINNEQIIYENILDSKFEQPWHIKRVLKQLEFIYGKENKEGKINLLENGLIENINELTLKNAEIITNQKLK